VIARGSTVYGPTINTGSASFGLTAVRATTAMKKRPASRVRGQDKVKLLGVRDNERLHLPPRFAGGR
jgi:hypothetical protein